MAKKLRLILLGLLIILFSMGCSHSATDAEKKEVGFNKESLATYENLITATDAEVVKALGEGNAGFIESEIEGVTYKYLGARVYEGCPFDFQGEIRINYDADKMEERIAGTFDESTLPVYSIIMSGALPKEKAGKLKATIDEMFGSPASEDTPFNGEEEYMGFWQGEKAQYQLWYVPYDEKPDYCGVAFAIYPVDFLPDIDNAIAPMEYIGEE